MRQKYQPTPLRLTKNLPKESLYQGVKARGVEGAGSSCSCSSFLPLTSHWPPHLSSPGKWHKTSQASTIISFSEATRQQDLLNLEKLWESNMIPMGSALIFFFSVYSKVKELKKFLQNFDASILFLCSFAILLSSGSSGSLDGLYWNILATRWMKSSGISITKQWNTDTH